MKERIYIQIAEDSVPFKVVKKHIDKDDTEFEFGGMLYIINNIKDNGDLVISVDFAKEDCGYYGTYTLEGKAFTIDD